MSLWLYRYVANGETGFAYAKDAKHLRARVGAKYLRKFGRFNLTDYKIIKKKDNKMDELIIIKKDDLTALTDGDRAALADLLDKIRVGNPGSNPEPRLVPAKVYCTTAGDVIFLDKLRFNQMERKG